MTRLSRCRASPRPRRRPAWRLHRERSHDDEHDRHRPATARLLEEERQRIVDALENLHEETTSSLEEQTGEEAAFDNHPGDVATETFDRELDYTLEENSEQLLAAVDAALEADRRRDVRDVRAVRQADRGRAARGDAVRVALHRAPTRAGARLSEPARRIPDVRVGTRRTASRRSRSRSGRSLRARAQWASLALVVTAAVGADQLTKQLVSSELALGEEVEVTGPFSIHHVQNSGIAFGLFSSATVIVIVLTALAVGWMLLFFARSGARHPVLPVGLGLVIGGSLSNLVDRVRLGHVTDFLDLTLLAGVQPRRHVHRRRRRGAARRSARGRSGAAPAPVGLRRLGNAFLTRPPGNGSTASSPRCRRSARGRGGAAARGRRRPARRNGAAEEPPARGWGGARRSSCRSRRRPSSSRSDGLRSGSPTRTSTCSSWTSPPASSCTPPPATGRERWCTDSWDMRRRVGRSRSDRGSSIASTATRPGCSSSPARTRRTGASRH